MKMLTPLIPFQRNAETARTRKQSLLIVFAVVTSFLTFPSSALDTYRLQDELTRLYQIRPNLVRIDLHAEISKNAEIYSVPEIMLAALMTIESNFDSCASSRDKFGNKVASGIAQFTESTARLYNLYDPYRPAQAIRAMAAYLEELTKTSEQDHLVIAAYNAGPDVISLPMNQWPEETQRHVVKFNLVKQEMLKSGWRSLTPKYVNYSNKTLCKTDL